MSGEPGDFDGLVDYPYRNAIIQAFVKTDSSAFVADIDRDIRPVIAANFPPGRHACGWAAASPRRPR